MKVSWGGQVNNNSHLTGCNFDLQMFSKTSPYHSIYRLVYVEGYLCWLKVFLTPPPPPLSLSLSLLYRHECFTGKYTTRKIHNNYIRELSGLFYLTREFIDDVISVVSLHYFIHRRTGNFRPGGTVNHLPKKILASCPNFYKTVEKKWGPYDATK